MEELSYRIEDRTIVELLGMQNFTNDESAILELVKNAYDAKATELILEFESNTIKIVDNGLGMNSDDIKTRWMRVGFSDKGYVVIDDQANTRVLAGSKGIGRFALSRLGKKITMYSKKSGSLGIIWETDWEKSSLSEDPENDTAGTTIVIQGVRQKWTQKRVRALIDFLSRTYNDTSMSIWVKHPDTEPTLVMNCFPEAHLGVNCLCVISMKYDAKQKTLTTDISSDEFTDEAEQYCTANIKKYNEKNDIFVDLKTIMDGTYSADELADGLETLGDFSAELYFAQHPSKQDMESFCYKHYRLSETIGDGIILYRNAFSISSFEGKRDWLGLGKRSRKSTASPTHPTGNWRVRENQVSGKVEIDKMRNPELKDLSNRQGIEENFQYNLFVEIILIGLSNFERYRQGIIREINKKNANEVEDPLKNSTPIADKVAAQPASVSKLSPDEANQLAREIKKIKEDEKASKKEREDVEERYKYDVRILNVLSTIGLKASSIAHEMQNDRNTIQNNVDYIIKALQEYGMWEELNDADHTAYKFQNVPQLLNDDRRVSKKLVTFMDTMLSEIQKKKFVEPVQSITSSMERLCTIWERDYSWIKIHWMIDDGVVLQLHEDVMQVILDNLILNSIQQNHDKVSLEIEIAIEQINGMARFLYKDNGKGLDPKYYANPRKILEVHETTRTEGHGLGMWIINNTVTMSGGEVVNITPAPGFSIEFTMGGATA